jgi:hypothetical protein
MCSNIRFRDRRLDIGHLVRRRMADNRFSPDFIVDFSRTARLSSERRVAKRVLARLSHRLASPEWKFDAPVAAYSACSETDRRRGAGRLAPPDDARRHVDESHEPLRRFSPDSAPKAMPSKLCRWRPTRPRSGSGYAARWRSRSCRAFRRLRHLVMVESSSAVRAATLVPQARFWRATSWSVADSMEAKL